jgi:hypothetical protein
MLDKKTLYITLAAIFTFVSLIMLFQYFFRFESILYKNPKQAPVATIIPQQTNSSPVYKPYVNTLLTPPPFDTVTLTFTAEGVSVAGEKSKVATNDVISIVNQDSINHSVRIQEREIVLEPGSAYGYPVTANNTATITVVLDNSMTDTYTYEIQ